MVTALTVLNSCDGKLVYLEWHIISFEILHFDEMAHNTLKVCLGSEYRGTCILAGVFRGFSIKVFQCSQYSSYCAALFHAFCNLFVGMTHSLTTPTKAPTPVAGSAVTGSAVARTPPKRQTGVSLPLDQITISTSSLCKEEWLLQWPLIVAYHYF